MVIFLYMQVHKSANLALFTPSNRSSASTDISSVSSSPPDFFCDETLDLELLDSCDAAKRGPASVPRSSIDAYRSELQIKSKVYEIDGSLIYENQTEIKPIVRAILVDWILQICSEVKLQRETFYKAMYFVDKYMMIRPRIKRDDFQLIGVTCLWIALKSEEVNSIRVKNLLEMTGSLYTQTQLKEMELDILIKLGWRLSPPTPLGWMHVIINLWDLCVARSRYPEIKQLNIMQSYETYKEIMDRLDTLYFDLRTLVFSPQKLSAALVYAVLQTRLQNLLKKSRAERRAPLQKIEFSGTTQRVDYTYILFKKFSKFLTREGLCKFEELANEMSYVSCFMDLQISYDPSFESEEYFKASHSVEKLKFVMSRIRRQCKAVI
jgi:hypothetical protein